MSEGLQQVYDVVSDDPEIQVISVCMEAIRRGVENPEFSRVAPIRITEYLCDWAESLVRSIKEADDE